MKKIILTLFCLFCLNLSACSIYRLNVQQGNIIDTKQQHKLRVGMTKEEVAEIISTPVMTDPFRANRWNYVYTFKANNLPMEKRKMTLYFREDRLVAIRGRYHQR